jgi:two-component system sensor histidine kinase KdpD
MTRETGLSLPARPRRALLRRWPLAGLPQPLQIAFVTLVALATSTAAVAAIEQVMHASYAAPVYLLAVLPVGILYGTLPAVVTSVASFLLYDYLFVQPLYAFTISSPDEWLNLLLLLVVSVAVGRLVALLAQRAAEAAEQAREAQALFHVSTALAGGRTVTEVAQVVLARLADATEMDRVWLALGPSPADERTVADTASGEPLPVPTRHVVLQRGPGGEPSGWVHTHLPSVRDPRLRGSGRGTTVHRVKVEVPGEQLGSIWALRARVQPDPDRVETWILAAAADQVAQAVVRDRMALESTNAEIVRQSEALKTALLDSVSHDLRTPLATIRAAAGSLLDRSVSWSREDQEATLRTIDAQADRMNRLVRNLLDMSRIEGGALRPELEAYDVDEALERSVQLVRASGAKQIDVDVPRDLPAVLVDEVYLGQIALNLLENAIRYGGNDIRIGASQRADGMVEVLVEDDGAGVPASALPHLFEKFYRAPGAQRSRSGMGIGLTVVAGLARAMGGDVEARQSELGGLAVAVTLRAAPRPPVDEASV